MTDTRSCACRKRGLSTVAITDHHDTAFFPYIKAAAAAETDQHGGDIPAGERLIVFPGMELTLQRESERDQLQLDSLTKQVEALKKSLGGVSNEDRKVLDDHDGFLSEEQTLKGWDRALDRVRGATAALLDEVARATSGVAQPTGKDRLNSVQSQFQGMYRQAKEQADALSATLGGSSEQLQKLGGLRKAWETAFEQHKKEYEAAKQRSSAHETQLKQIAEAEERIRRLRESLAEKNERLSRIGSPEAAYADARKEWLTFYEQRGELLEGKCQELTTLSSRAIRATVKRGAGCRHAATNRSA